MGGSRKGLLFRAGFGGGKGKRGGGVRSLVCPVRAFRSQGRLGFVSPAFGLVQSQRLQHQQDGQDRAADQGGVSFEFVEDHSHTLHQCHNIANKIGFMSLPSRSLFA